MRGEGVGEQSFARGVLSSLFQFVQQRKHFTSYISVAQPELMLET